VVAHSRNAAAVLPCLVEAAFISGTADGAISDVLERCHQKWLPYCIQNDRNTFLDRGTQLSLDRGEFAKLK